MRKHILFVPLLLLMAMAVPFSAAGAAGDRQEFLQAFTYSYENPGDIDAALRYAEAAVNIGDYEAAIPPLERILMFNPSLNEVRLEVGVLYYLLNSKDMAREHLTIVAQADGVTRDMKTRAADYLAKL